MNERERRYSFGFSRRQRPNQISQYLINQMGFDPPVAMTLLSLHLPSNLQQVFDLFLTNEEQLINHYFLPSKEPQTDQCRVCEGKREEHIKGDEREVAEIWEKEVQKWQNRQQNGEFEGQEKQTCQICCIEVEEREILKIKDVKHNICLQCIESYLKEEIGNMRVADLSCPHCGNGLPNDVIQELIDRPTYNKYRQFLRNLEIHKNPNLKWCPNPKCSIVVNTNPKKKISQCPQCSTLICNRCNRQAHPKSSCQADFQKEIKGWQNAKDVQKCKKCSGLVQKIEGCNHMTCSVCQFQWCWLCGSQFSNAHFSPLNPFGCPGLQDRHRTQWTKCKILALRIGIFFLILLGSPLMLPLAMIAVGPVILIQVFHDCLYPTNCGCKTFVVMLGILLGLLTDPVVWVGCLVYFIPKGLIRLWTWWKRKRMEERQRDQFLRERLLGEQIYEQPGAV